MEGAPSALIIGLAGPVLSAWERDFFREVNPFGFILFARNCIDPGQLRTLTAALRDSVARAAPILIDQEGGRVARLRPPHWRATYPASRFARVRDASLAEQIVRDQARLAGWELADVGIDVNCAPVCDLRVDTGDTVIGDRAFSHDPDRVSALAEAYCLGLLDVGVLPVIKHIPGHGRADCDSHHATPIIRTPKAILRRRDFAPFRALSRMPVAMTGHLVFRAYDPDRVASESDTVIQQVIRDEIGFRGLLISDDLGMAALSGRVADRMTRSLIAGCDIALLANPDRDLMRELANGAPPVAAECAARCDAALALRRARITRPHDIQPMADRVAAAIGAIRSANRLDPTDPVQQ